MAKILIVEDDETLAKMYQKKLEYEGFLVQTAFSGEDGLKAVSEDKPDLILLDIMMPGIDGFAVIKKLKADDKSKDIPIIILTASGAKDLERKCMALGVEEIIQKPYESSYLLERIAFYLGES